MINSSSSNQVFQRSHLILPLQVDPNLGIWHGYRDAEFNCATQRCATDMLGFIRGIRNHVTRTLRITLGLWSNFSNLRYIKRHHVRERKAGRMERSLFNHPRNCIAPHPIWPSLQVWALFAVGQVFLSLDSSTGPYACPIYLGRADHTM